MKEPKATSSTKRSPSAYKLAKNGTTGWPIEDGVYGSLASGTPYTRDEMGHRGPNLAYKTVRLLRSARARTLSPRSLPAAGAPHALTHPAYPVGRPRPCFFAAFCFMYIGE